MSWLLSVPISLCFTAEAELTTLILQLGELRCLERRWHLQGHLLGNGCIWTESTSLHPNQALFLVLVFLFFRWRLHAFSDYISDYQRSIAHIWSPLLPLKLSDCSQRRLSDWGRFELCASNSVIPCQSTGRVHRAPFPGAKRECLWHHKIHSVCLSKLNGLYTA